MLAKLRLCKSRDDPKKQAHGVYYTTHVSCSGCHGKASVGSNEHERTQPQPAESNKLGSDVISCLVAGTALHVYARHDAAWDQVYDCTDAVLAQEVRTPMHRRRTGFSGT